MRPAKIIADLDAALARAGTSVTLRRETTPTPTDLVVRAAERPFAPDELTGGIRAGDHRLVISPTGLDAAAWVAAFAATGGQSLATPFDVDPGLPRRGDSVIIANRLRTIENVRPIFMDETVVRIEMAAR